MREQLHTLKKYRYWEGASFLTVAAAAIGLCVGAVVVDKLPLFPQSFFYHAKTAIFEPHYYAQFALKNWYSAIPFFALPLASMIGSAYGTWLFFGKLIDPIVHLRGRQLWRGKEAVERAITASKKAISQGGKGIEIFPSIFLSRDQEGKSLLVCGAQGGGKTVFYNATLTKVFRRGDKCLIFDPTKGDYSSWVPMTAGLRLLSTTDSRSMIWWLGFDIRDEADAFALWSGYIKVDGEIWGEGSMLVGVGLTMHLISTYGEEWSWEHLSEVLNLSIAEKHALLLQSYPSAATLMSEDSKTSQSLEINLKVYAASITRLAAHFSRIDPKKRFSFREWLNDDNTKHRNILIQMNQRDAKLGASMSRSLVGYCINHMASLEFPESNTRKICYSFDELPEFHGLEVSRIMSVLRSKGGYCLLGFQDISMINQIYPEHESQKWAALLGTRIFPQVVGSDSQKWVCDQIGEREVQYRLKNVSGQGTGQLNVSSSYSQPTMTPVLLPSELELFGKRPDGIEMLVLGLGKDALALTMPFPHIKKLRPAHVPWSTSTPATAKTEHIREVFEPSEAARAPASSSNLAQLSAENTPEAVPAVEATDNTIQVEMLEMLAINERQQQQEIGKDNDDAMKEILGEVAESSAIHVLSESLGVPSIVLEVAENLADSQAPEAQNINVDVVSQPTKKRIRKQRKYENEAA